MDQPPRARHAGRLADICVLLCIAGLVLLYGVDAIIASTAILNLIFVLPVAVVLIVLCLVQLVVILRYDASEQRAERFSDVVPVIGLFAAYVLLLPLLGFDFGTMLFVAAFLWLKGERRRIVIAGYSIGFALALAIAFSQLLPYAMPMRLLPLFY